MVSCLLSRRARSASSGPVMSTSSVDGHRRTAAAAIWSGSNLCSPGVTATRRSVMGLQSLRDDPNIASDAELLHPRLDESGSLRAVRRQLDHTVTIHHLVARLLQPEQRLVHLVDRTLAKEFWEGASPRMGSAPGLVDA